MATSQSSLLQFQQTLRHELAKRKSKNPRYSLRAFARDLNISPSRLSEIMHSNESPSQETLQRLMMQLSAHSSACNRTNSRINSKINSSDTQLLENAETAAMQKASEIFLPRTYIIPRTIWRQWQQTLENASDSEEKADPICLLVQPSLLGGRFAQPQNHQPDDAKT